jgi:hypothetical protein
MTAEPTKTPQQVQRARDIEALTKLWVSGMPTIPPPSDKQWELWFDIHRNDFGVVVYGVQECLRLYNQRGGVMDQDHAIRHSSRCMNCYSRDRARGNKPAKHFPMNILTKGLADAVGLPPGIAVTEAMFWRIHSRALAIRQGRVARPSTAIESSDAAETKKAA